MRAEAMGSYLVIGHVCQDILPDGTLVAGGTATYSALVAHRLGRSTAVLTRSAPDLTPFPHHPAIRVSRRPSCATTRFENVYSGGERRQYLRSRADAISVADLLDERNQASIVHLGPIAQEVDPALVDAFDEAFIGVTPQGWMRRWDQGGRVYPTVWQGAEKVLERADAVVLSPEDLGRRRDLLTDYAKAARLLVVTLGADGAVVHQRGRSRRYPAYQVEVRDPTGAGDAFAAGFLVRYAETGDPHESARFANSVASFMVEGIGVVSSFSRADVERRVQQGKLRS